jgi:hypothetical protein
MIYSRITMSPMLELKHQEQTNSSVAWKIEICDSYLAKVSTKEANSEKLGLEIGNPRRRVLIVYCG